MIISVPNLLLDGARNRMRSIAAKAAIQALKRDRQKQAFVHPALQNSNLQQIRRGSVGHSVSNFRFPVAVRLLSASEALAHLMSPDFEDAIPHSLSAEPSLLIIYCPVIELLIGVQKDPR